MAFARTGACPCGGQFAAPKRGTGRHPRRMRRVRGRCRQILVFREGMIDPDLEYCERVIKALCPGAADSAPSIKGFAVEDWEQEQVMLRAQARTLILARMHPNAEMMSLTGVYQGDRILVLALVERSSA